MKGINIDMCRGNIGGRESSRSRAITSIIKSVADEQSALARLIKAEAKKVKVVTCAAGVSVDQILTTNESAREMVVAITELETVLQTKLALFGDCLCEDEDEEDAGEE